MGKRFDILSISELRNRDIFVDANVLIHLFWSTKGSEKLEIGYSSVYSKLLEQKNVIYVDFIVLSEVVNRVIKIETKKNDIHSDNYKQFRNSDDGQRILNDVYTIIQERILEDFRLVGKVFTKENIEEFLCVNSLDFNDKAILKICQENNFVLLTHDKDFKAADIDILSCSSTLRLPL